MHSDKQCPFDGGSRSMKCMYKAPKEFSCCFTKLLHMQCIQGTFHSTECSQMQKTFFFLHNAIIMYVSNHQILLNKMQDHHYYNIVVVWWKYCPFFHLWFLLCSICNFPDPRPDIFIRSYDVHTIFMFVGHIFCSAILLGLISTQFRNHLKFKKEKENTLSISAKPGIE